MKHRKNSEAAAFPPQADGPAWDRRRSPRLAAAESRLWLGWRKADDFFVVGAEILNISQGGALVLANESPSKGECVWLRLEGPTPIEDVCALVLDSSPIGGDEHGVRIAFREPFPTGFYHAAIEGLQAAQQL